MAEVEVSEPNPNPNPNPNPAGDPPPADPATPPADPAKGAEPKPGDPPKNGHDGTDWRATITDPKLKEFATRMASPADAVKTAYEMRQKLSTAVVVPGKDAKPEELAEYHKKIGVPESADKYELAAAEGQEIDENFKGLMAKTFHGLKITGEQAKGLNEAWNGYLAEQAEARKAAVEKTRTEAEAELRKEWAGGEFDINVKHARAAANAFGGETFLAWVEKATIDGVPVGNHPHFLRTFAQIGRRMGEDTSHIGLTAEDVASTKDAISQKRSELREASAKGDQGAVSRIRAELDNLYEKAYPGERKF